MTEVREACAADQSDVPVPMTLISTLGPGWMALARYHRYGKANAGWPVGTGDAEAFSTLDIGPNWKSPSSRRRRLSVLVEIAVVPEAAERAGVQARLVRIDLPRVQVEDCRARLRPVDAADAPVGPGVRQDPEVAAAGDRQVQRPSVVVDAGASTSVPRGRRSDDTDGAATAGMP